MREGKKQSPVAPLAYRIDDAARCVGISRSKLYELIGEGELAITRIGGRSVILAADLSAYVEHCAQRTFRRAA